MISSEETRSSRHPFSRHEPELAADCALGPEIVAAGPLQAPPGGPGVILLTGATGFLGAYLLRDLLAHTRAVVVCLVRAATPAQARMRLEENLAACELRLPAAHWRRVEALPGDLTKRGFGLGEAAYEGLAGRVEAIFHGAAVVNFYKSYRALRAANVGGTREILRFAVHRRTKALHYISSIGVFDSDAYRGIAVSEADNPAHCHGSAMGYTQSKWVAEQLVLGARTRGIPSSVYRAPFIMGDSASGLVDEENLVVKTLIGSIQGGAWPDVSTEVEMVPVDALSRAIVHLAGNADCLGRTFHVTSPQVMRWSDIGQVARDFGYALEPQTWNEWKQRLGEFGRSEGNALRPLVRFFTRVARPGMSVADFFARPPRPIFRSTATQAALAPAGLVPPPIAGLMAVYFDYFVRRGWLSRAPARPAGRSGNSRPPYAA